MKEIFIVFQVKLGRRDQEFMRHAFTNEEEARRFCVNFLYSNSTLEDRTYNKIQEYEWPGYTEYSLYTNFYGELTLRIKKTTLD